MKRLSLIALLSWTPTLVVATEHETKELVLTAEILRVLDGIFLGAADYGMMLQSRQAIMKVLYGNRTKDGHVGTYTFGGEKHSIRTLSKMEQQLIADFKKRVQEVQNGTRSKMATAEEDAIFQETMQQLQELLLVVKKDFEKATAPFIEQADGGKKQMIMLIEESCQKRNRGDSLLLSWAHAKAGEETKIFHEKVVTFEKMDLFCSDLINFISDMLRSLPKAEAQFRKAMRDTKMAQVESLIKRVMTKPDIKPLWQKKNMDTAAVVQTFTTQYEQQIMKMPTHDLVEATLEKMLVQMLK